MRSMILLYIALEMVVLPTKATASRPLSPLTSSLHSFPPIRRLILLSDWRRPDDNPASHCKQIQRFINRSHTRILNLSVHTFSIKRRLTLVPVRPYRPDGRRSPGGCTAVDKRLTNTPGTDYNVYVVVLNTLCRRHRFLDRTGVASGDDSQRTGEPGSDGAGDEAEDQDAPVAVWNERPRAGFTSAWSHAPWTNKVTHLPLFMLLF